jgi:hypothetical protein
MLLLGVDGHDTEICEWVLRGVECQRHNGRGPHFVKT